MVIQDENRKLKFCNNTLELMQKYIQKDNKSNEAGGILIGRENAGNANLVIEFATEPMPKDQRSRCRFLRKDTGHMHFFEKLHKENGEIYGYVGEWHTHPEYIPHYSHIDLKNWRKIGKKMKTEKQYHLIVGIQEIGVWKYDVVTKKITQIDSVKWGRIVGNEEI